QGKYPSFSPRGNEIAFAKQGSSYEIFLMNKDGTNIRQLTNNDIDDIELTFSPDGEKIAYNSGGNIYTMNKDGGGQTKVIRNGTTPIFSPDGKKLGFLYYNTLWVLDLTTYELTKIAQGIKGVSWSVGTVDPQIAKESPQSIVHSPQVSALFQSFPNPARDGCWIPFQLAIDSDQLSISIYNIVGQKVRAIDVGPRKAGVYTEAKQGSAVFWDGKNDSGQKLANGLYFYQLRAGEFSACKSMVVR
ncbi:MAG: FlgD immunoglobulin-like domain containing protein, partial [bacterium]